MSKHCQIQVHLYFLLELAVVRNYVDNILFTNILDEGQIFNQITITSRKPGLPCMNNNICYQLLAFHNLDMPSKTTSHKTIKISYSSVDHRQSIV